ncbi:MAG: hypothetical protein RRB22_04380 [Gammaproteobacteria bacterium]|nr:hypothetical protein [Gammaproteobacteria bacterium]
METAEEVQVLSGRVGELSKAIMSVSEVASKDQVLFKKFLQAERKELTGSIGAATDKLDKSSKASLWLTSAIAFFAFVEAGSIFYDAFLKN